MKLIYVVFFLWYLFMPQSADLNWACRISFCCFTFIYFYMCIWVDFLVCVCGGGLRACTRKTGKSCLSPIMWVLGNQAQIITHEARAILLACLWHFSQHMDFLHCLLCQGVSVFSWLKNYPDNFGSYTTYSLMWSCLFYVINTSWMYPLSPATLRQYWSKQLWWFALVSTVAFQGYPILVFLSWCAASLLLILFQLLVGRTFQSI